MVRPLNGALAPPWVFVRSSPVHPGESETPTYLSLSVPDCGVTRRPSPKARPLFTRPCRPFWSAFAELIRDQTPPDDFCNCVSFDVRATKPGPLDPRRDGGLDHLPFLTHHALFLRSGDARRAARRPPSTTPVLVLPACAGLPSRDASESALLAKSGRARVEGPSEGRVPWRRQRSLVPRVPVPTPRERGPTAFPSSASSRHPRSSARSFAAEEPRRPTTSRPRPSFR